MARARHLSNPTPGPSNVVELRPGFTLPEAPEPVADPPKKRGGKRLGRPPKHLQRGTTDAQDLQRDTTTTSGKKLSPAKDLQRTTSLIHYKENDVVSCPVANSALLPKRVFMRLVHDLPAMKLRERFRSEEIAHKGMLQRRRKGAIIHPEFVEFRSFLIHTGQRPNDLWSLDRLDVANPMYGPGLAEYSDPRQQAANRHRTTFLKVRGEVRPLTDFARMTGQKADTLRARLARGYSHEEVVYGRGKGPTEPVEAAPAMPVTERMEDGWPTGATPSKWEAPFIEYKARFAAHLVYDLSRSVFFAWLGGNLLRSTMARLRERYPGFDDPDATEPPAVRADPQYAVIAAYDAPVREAHQVVWADPHQRELLLSLRLQWPSVTDPTRVRTDCRTG